MFLFIYSYIADLILGDPEGFPHPVRWMGRLITFLEKVLRRSGGAERLKGAVLAVVVVGISGCFVYLCLVASRKINPVFGDLVWVYFGYAALSIKDLRVKALGVLKGIRGDSPADARNRLSMIVARDTQALNEDGMIRATVESVAESTNDGIVAPLFYLILGGPVLAMVYKSINTLDSMVGYRNEKYLHFGWFSAKLDDIANFIPARLSGILIAVSAAFCGRRPIAAFKTMFSDSGRHLSPNSGVSEAAMAGALGIRLGGVSFYGGNAVQRPYIGKQERDSGPSFINEALVISFTVSLLMVFMGAILRCLI
ncbi:MAG: adenosylcobinamide-phosphate synthase CbiB [Candidatus Omnitrophota bacterium]